MSNYQINIKSTRSAVSLVELAIVILVLGILVTVISGANSLIRAAKIRSVVNEFDTIVLAHRNFVATYDKVPGDMINAYDYFGTSCTSSATSSYCNGDGDKQVEMHAWNDESESLRYFQHLKLANILEGNYGGVGLLSTDYDTACDSHHVLDSTCLRVRGYNVPKTKISKVGFYTVTYNSTHKNNVITLGDRLLGPGDEYALNEGVIVSAANADDIDEKLDDGFASKGRFIGKENDNNTLCLDASGEYDILVTGINCYVEYIIR